MLMPWLSRPNPLSGPDVETTYYATESGQHTGDYIFVHVDSPVHYVGREQTPRTEYRIEPTRR